jgi:hypothetical protein
VFGATVFGPAFPVLTDEDRRSAEEYRDTAIP